MTRLRFAVLAIVVCALPTPVLAQAQAPVSKAGAEYYVIVDTRTKKCTVVDKAPQVDSPSITLASDAIYATRHDAEAAMKSLKSCVPS